MSLNSPRGAVVPPNRAPQAVPRVWWRRQLGLLLGAAAGLVICLLAFVVARAVTGTQSHMPAPAPTAQTICTDLERQNYGDLFARLAPTQRAAGSEQQFVASQRELDRLRGTVTSCSYTLPNVGAGAATARLTLVRGSGAPIQADVVLGAEDGVWQVESYDSSAV